MKRRLTSAISTAREDRANARSLALGDLDSFTRTCFLASAIDAGVHHRLDGTQTRADLAAAIGVVDDERFQAWVTLGLSLRELGERKGLLYPRGRRMKAITNEDMGLISSYRSALNDQSSLFGNIVPLLTAASDHNTNWPQPRSYTSLLASAALAPILREAATEAPVARFLDIGCHDGDLIAPLLRPRPSMTGVAIDSDAELLGLAKQRMNRRGWGQRVETRNQDVEHIAAGIESFGLITLVNRLCHIEVERRPKYLNHIVKLLEPGGLLVIVALVSGGSEITAGVDLALKSQKADLRLPSLSELKGLIKKAELGVIHEQQVVPGESLYAITTYRGWI